MKKIVALCLCILFSVTVFFSMNQDDYLLLQFRPSDMIVPQAMQSFSEQAKALFLPEGYDEYTGEIMRTPELMLEPGVYHISFGYQAGAGGSRIAAFSTRYPDSDSVAARIYADVPMPATGAEYGHVDFSIELDQRVTDLVFAIIYSGGSFAYVTINLEAESRYYNDAFFAALSALAVGLLFIFLFDRAKKRAGPPSLGRAEPVRMRPVCWVFLLFLLALFSTLPLMRPYLTGGHDFMFHAVRIESMRDALLSGQFPVRMDSLSAGGVGYAVHLMYPNLFLYFPALLRLLGVSPLVAYIAFLFFLNLLTAWICFFSVKKLLRSDTAGFAAAAIYTLSLYRLVNIYTRAAVGEVIGMAFFPLILLGIYEVVAGEVKNYRYLVFGFVGAAFGHLISVVLGMLFCAVFALANLRRALQKERLLALLKSAGLVLLCTLWLLLPLLSLSGQPFNVFTPTPDNGIDVHVISPWNLFSVSGDPYGVSLPRSAIGAEMPFGIGVPLLLGALLWLFGRYVIGKPFPEDSARLERLGCGCLILGAVSLFAATDWFPWGLVANVPLLGRIAVVLQFSWRLIGPATVFLTLLTVLAALRFCDSSKKKAVAAVIAVACAALSAVPFLDAYAGAASPVISLENKWGQLDYAFENLYFEVGDSADALMATPQYLLSNNPTVRYQNYRKEGVDLSFDLSVGAPGETDVIRLPLYYYPVYAAKLNGEEVPLAKGEDGFLHIVLPSGSAGGRVSVGYRGYWFYTLGDLVSLLSAAGVTARAVILRRRKNAARKKDLRPLPS